MSVRVTISVCAIFSLAACAGAPDPEAEKAKFLTPKGDAINVEFSDKSQAESVLGFRATTVRTIPNASSSGGSGSSGQGTVKDVSASCTLAGNGYAAQFDTPAVVNMPSFGKDTQPVDVTCTYQDKDYSKTFKAVNLSSGSRDGTALAVGVILCPICGVVTAVANGGDKEGDAYGFDDMAVRVK